MKRENFPFPVVVPNVKIHAERRKRLAQAISAHMPGWHTTEAAG